MNSCQDLTLEAFIVCGIPLAGYWVAVCLGQNMLCSQWKKVRVYHGSLAQKSFQMNAQQTLHPFRANHAQLMVGVVSDK